ncbi:hypothetical protein [Burkholderia vietnamiensis]|uniref:hypothetical protein n=1 Tax=Burkholderia vietnamiensis TaxID=60552 RepID=UPI001592B8BC|nr:hypothetical protein [Burkholderia vietnamiensis]
MSMPIILCAVVLAALLFLCNRWSLRLIATANGGDTRSRKSMVKAGGAMLLNYGVLVLIGFLWFLVAAVLNQSETLHEKGVPAMAVGLAVFNPVLMLMLTFMGRD